MLLDLATARTDDEFNRHEPGFNRAYRDVQTWLSEKTTRGDDELVKAVRHLMGLCDHATCFHPVGGAGREIREMVLDLRKALESRGQSF